MEDDKIVSLYWERNESAITETQQKYSRYLTKIAMNILYNHEDSEETVNDTYIKAWNTMPPHKPCTLSLFLGKITRQLSIDRWRSRTREKRGGTEYAVSLDELSECVSGSDDTAQATELKLLAAAISTYLRNISEEKRCVFIWRYYYCDSVKDIAQHLGASESKVKSMLHRTREGLKAHLESEGYTI